MDQNEIAASEPQEILIRVRLRGADSLPTSFVSSSIEVIEDEVFRAEYEELEAIFSEIEEVSPIVRDACFHRIREYKGSSLLFESAGNGSLILIGVGAALAYWIVENTIGESLKDAYKESGMHSRLKKLFLSRLPGRGKELSRRLNERLFQPISDPKVIAEIKFESNGHITINADLRINRLEKIPPTPRQWLRGDRPT